tara:strand:+ start:119 stop:1156 length:1038 start_codon:yes stop_codon:yes gene_type:complete
MNYTSSEIAEHVEGEVVGDAQVRLSGFAQPNSAKPGDLTFAENEKYFSLAEQSQASAILAPDEFKSKTKTVIRVKDARIAFARVLPLLVPERTFIPGIHPSATVSESAQIADTAYVGPNCVIGEQTVIGSDAVLEANCIIGNHSSLGKAVRFSPNVTVYSQCLIGDQVRIHAGSVVGSDGFGYVFDQDHHRKIPQVGGVVIGKNVEIGANVTIDRGALGNTKIGEGTKIDNLVQIGHNVVIGKHCIIVAQNGIGGSTKVGEYSTLAGQAGIAGHLVIGPKSVIAAKAGVINNLDGGKQYMGFPAIPDREAKRQIITLQKLPELAKRIQEIEQHIPKEESPNAPSD